MAVSLLLGLAARQSVDGGSVMKRIFLSITCLIGLSTLAACSSDSGNTATAVTSTACTYSNGYYYYNGVPYATCPVASTTTTGTCTYSNGLYYYNGVAYSTCPTSTATTHNCANQTLRDSMGQVGVCSVQYNYCAGYTMYYPGTSQVIYCQ